MADKENIYGIKYEVDIDELKTSTAEATKKIKLANAEFKESSSKLGDWGSSTDGVGAKLKQLNIVLEANKSKLANLKNEYNKSIDSIKKYDQQMADLQKQKENAIEQYGKESKEVEDLNTQIAKLQREQNTAVSSIDRLKVSILNQQASINKTEKEIEKYNSKLNDIQSENIQTVSSMDKLKNSITEQEKELTDLKDEYANVVLEQGKASAEAQKLASRIKELNGNLKASKTTLNDAESEADQLADALQSAGEGAQEGSGGFTIMKGVLADLTANAITSAISKVGEFVGALFSMSEATEEYRSMNAKIEGSAISFGYSMDFAKQKYADFYAYLGDDQMSANAITNLMGLGVSVETITNLANAGISVWSAYGDSIPIEGLTESMNETAQVAKVTGSLADALNWAGISEDEFNEKLEKLKTTQERADLIAQTLNGTYGESKKKYDELTGSMTEANRAELELKDSQAQLGGSMEPVNTAINNLKAKALDLIAPAVEKFAQGILNLNDYLKENPTVTKIVTATVLGLATAFGILAGALAIQTLIKGVTTAFKLLNKTMLANPFVLIASLIAGVVAGFIYLWNTSEGFRNFWKGLWDSIVNFVSGAVNSVADFFTVTIPETFNRFLEYVGSFISGVQTFFSNMWTSIVNFFTETIPAWIDSVIEFFQKIPYYIGYMVGYVIAQFVQWGADLWNFATVTIPDFIKGVIEWFASLPGKIWEWLVNAFDKVKNWGSDLIAKAGEIGSDFINGVIKFAKELPGKIWDAIIGAVKSVGDWGADLVKKGLEGAQNLVDTVIEKAKELPGMLKDVGIWLVEGLWEGITSLGDWIGGKIEGFCDGVVDGFKDFFDINSPSKEFYWIGEMLTKGLGNAISDGTKGVVKTAKKMASNVISTMKESLNDKLTLGIDYVDNLKTRTANAVRNIGSSVAGNSPALAGANVNNVTFNQYNTSPKNIDSLETYRNTQKQLKLFKAWKGEK